MTDLHPRDHAPAPADLDRIPQPGGRSGGVGSHELETESDDPAVLRQMIERARERLTFYESFDRIIGENIRRSGELMLETIALREEAQATENARIAREADIERDRQSERDGMRTLLVSLRDEVSTFQATMTTLARRIEDALQPFGPPTKTDDLEQSSPLEVSDDADRVRRPSPSTDTPPAASSPMAHEPGALPASELPVSPRSSFRPIRHATPQESPPESSAMTTAESAPPRKVDLVVNGISRATTALAFQRELGTKPGIVRVETREFAEGVLRLSVEIADDDALSDETFTTWTGSGTLSVVTRQPTLIALDITEG